MSVIFFENECNFLWETLYTTNYRIIISFSLLMLRGVLLKLICEMAISILFQIYKSSSFMSSSFLIISMIWSSVFLSVISLILYISGLTCNSGSSLLQTSLFLHSFDSSFLFCWFLVPVHVSLLVFTIIQSMFQKSMLPVNESSIMLNEQIIGVI